MAKDALSIKETGRVVAISGPIVKIEGLPYVKIGEILQIGGEQAMVFRFEKQFTPALIYQNFVYALRLEEFKSIKLGQEVERTNQVLKIPVGQEFLGKVVDPLGKDLVARAKIETKEYRAIESLPPQIAQRENIRKPLETGIKVIDALFPIGRGQRELILGDRKTGKTTIAIDAILNQKNVVCIYTSIGQKKSGVKEIVKILRDFGAMNYTVVVAAFASSSTMSQYLAPFSAMTLAEYFRDKGEDVLIIFDDLTKHAWVWREISLLLGVPPGREAYPGDIFYLHARLLERAGKLNKDFGGGSITALPICETREGDITEYIPTNLISITDGQLYLEKDLFQKGIKPAVNIGLSVSRVGAQAQKGCIKEVTRGLKIILSQHKELKKLIQLETKLSQESQKVLKRGDLLLEIFRQEKHQLVDTVSQSIIYWLVLNGLLDDYPFEKMKEFEKRFYQFLSDLHLSLKKDIEKFGFIDKTKQELIKIFKEFKLLE